jgi:predicted CoA-substrate-specific enzyme activase
MTENSNMLVAGIDIGAATAKTVILADGKILGYSIKPTGSNVKSATNKVIREALGKAGLSNSIDNLNYVVSTGYARESIEFANKTVTEIICHAKGAHYMIPTTRFIIDIGGQDSKAIEVDAIGNVINFVMNDKCAAGTGRFLEVMANVLEVNSVAKMGPLALQSKEPCTISSTCTVFAETEVVVLRGIGKNMEDLIAGVHKSVSARVAVMASSLTIRPDAVFTGGVAKNIGVKRFLEEELGIELRVPDEPQIIGALGAALIAQTELAQHH